MKILITNNKLDTFGGSENWCLTMAQALIKLGHTVHFQSNKYGSMAKIIQGIGAVNRLDNKYDLVLANHSTTKKFIDHVQGYKIQTVHSKFIDIEQPFKGVDKHIAITGEVKEHFKLDDVIYNPVNTDVFKETRQVSEKVKNVLCLCQGKEAQKKVKEFCNANGLNLHINTKWHNPLNQQQLAEKMNWADVVVSVGRGVYEALYCNRHIICYDSRGYDNQSNHYIINNLEFFHQLNYNFTGRFQSQATGSFEDYFELFNKMTAPDNQIKGLDYITIAKKYLSYGD